MASGQMRRSTVDRVQQEHGCAREVGRPPKRWFLESARAPLGDIRPAIYPRVARGSPFGLADPQGVAEVLSTTTGDPHDAAHVQPGLLGHPLSDSGGPSDAQNRPGKRVHHRIPAGRRLEGLPHRQERRQVVQRRHAHRSGADAAAAPVQRGAHRRRGVHAPKACFRVQRDQGGAALPDVHRVADPPRPGGARRGRGTHGRPERDKRQQKRQGHRVRSHGTDVFLLQHPGTR
mmetsp:Transcript_73037/g.236395  ORF Transcript_73037/g.236395 Transcript_73037/m.236395 type:complete len:232 (+) Transcript_73037:82-777(+)